MGFEEITRRSMLIHRKQHDASRNDGQAIGHHVEIASVRQQEPMKIPSSTTVTCSAVIPTWNEEAWLPRLLAALTTYPCVGEVVVADNESTDMTQNVAGRFGCRITSGGKPARARNRGAEAARQDIIAFIDADTLVPRRTLERAIKMIATGRADVYHCRVTPLSRDYVSNCLPGHGLVVPRSQTYQDSARGRQFHCGPSLGLLPHRWLSGVDSCG